VPIDLFEPFLQMRRAAAATPVPSIPPEIKRD
jgi:hypothetical protein